MNCLADNLACAAAIPPTTDTKADSRRDRDGPTSRHRSSSARASLRLWRQARCEPPEDGGCPWAWTRV